MSDGTVSAIVLAAGVSKRMGAPKLSLRFGGSTILELTIDNLLNSMVDEVIVVLGHRDKEMRSLIADSSTEPFKKSPFIIKVTEKSQQYIIIKFRHNSNRTFDSIRQIFKRFRLNNTNMRKITGLLS